MTLWGTPLLAEELAPPPGSPGALDRLSARFKLESNSVSVGSCRLVLPELAEPMEYILDRMESKGPGEDRLPYWTKLWPASLVLAQFAQAQAHRSDGPLLELGAGLGLPGLAAASAGRRVVLSDLDPDALEFARAAVELNHLEDRVEVTALDWTDPVPAIGRFSTVLGAEILYHPPLYPSLLELLPRITREGGSIFITHQERPFLIGFFGLAREQYRIRRTSRTLRGDGEETKVMLYALDQLASE